MNKIFLTLVAVSLALAMLLPISIYAQNEITINPNPNDTQTDTDSDVEPDGQAGQVAPLTPSEEGELVDQNREADVRDTQDLRAEFREYVQDPRSKVVRFEMILKSNIDSDRVRITWRIDGNARPVTQEAQLDYTISIRSGQTYVIPIEVIPVVPPIGETYGVTEVFGSARVFGVDSNVIATVRKNFASNVDREILPITQEYSSQKTVAFVFDIAKIVVIILIASLAGFYGFKKFAKWYKED